MMRVVQGGSLARFTGRKKKSHGSRISKFHFHENKQITYSFFSALTQGKAAKKNCLKKAKSRKTKERLHIANCIPLSFSIDNSTHSSLTCSDGPKKH